MTVIHQNPVSSHHSIDDASHQSDHGNGGRTARNRQTNDNNAQGLDSSTVVDISFQAELCLRAYQDRQKVNMADSYPSGSDNTNAGKVEILAEQTIDSIKTSKKDTDFFSQDINNMLSEIEKNIIKKSEPGYQYLVSVLNNNKMMVEDPRQLQEIMRKEQFFLSRRKPFMQNADFQSYSQVLNQFSNIVERQQYTSQSSF